MSRDLFPPIKITWRSDSVVESVSPMKSFQEYPGVARYDGSLLPDELSIPRTGWPDGIGAERSHCRTTLTA
jgi:hypothetical protein